MNNTFSEDSSHPRLKKVKRPKRPDMVTDASFNEPLSSQELDEFNLDSYLDTTPAHVPATQSNFIHEEKQVTQPQFLGINDTYAEDYHPYTPTGASKKNIIIFSAIAFIIGVIFAKLVLSETKVARDGLQGVIPNAEVPRGRPRCGLADKTQGCVLYLMNPQRQELNARDFYDLAAQLTGRQRFVVETGNMRYANTKIRPGEFGQFNIPPL